MVQLLLGYHKYFEEIRRIYGGFYTIWNTLYIVLEIEIFTFLLINKFALSLSWVAKMFVTFAPIEFQMCNKFQCTKWWLQEKWRVWRTSSNNDFLLHNRKDYANFNIVKFGNVWEGRFATILNWCYTLFLFWCYCCIQSITWSSPITVKFFQNLNCVRSIFRYSFKEMIR